MPILHSSKRPTVKKRNRCRLFTQPSHFLAYKLVSVRFPSNRQPPCLSPCPPPSWTRQAETFNGVGPGALKQSLKPRPELYDELLEAARTLPKVPAYPPSPAAAAAASAAGVQGCDAGGGELRGHHVTLRVLRAEQDAEPLFKACDGSPT